MSSEISRFSPLEINVGHEVFAVAFTANGQHLVSGGRRGVHVQRVQDGQRVAVMNAQGVYCIAVSKDDKWIAAGTVSGEVLVSDTATYQQVRLPRTNRDSELIAGVDFSPDSTHLISASWNRMVTIWNFLTRRQLTKLRHDDRVKAAKYSPQGDRIATATRRSVQVWDSRSGHSIARFETEVTGLYNTGLLWYDHHILVISDQKIKQIDLSTESTVSEWPIPDASAFSCIAMPQDGKFIACTAKDVITFWATATRTKYSINQRDREIRSIAFSPDNQHFAIASWDGKILFTRPSDLLAPLLQHASLQSTEINVEDDVLYAWNDGQLAHAETLLTAAVMATSGPSRHALASRALVRSRLGKWDAAIADAEESIKIQRSFVGYIAKFVSLLGKGKTSEAMRACDIAFQHFHSSHVTTLLLVKAVTAFMIGEHEDGISRVDDLITAVHPNSALYVVKTQMYFLLGKAQMNDGDYEHAIQSFKHAQGQLPDFITAPPLVISLISGWKFNELGITIRRSLLEALCTAERVLEADEAALDIINYVATEHLPITESVMDLVQRCLSTPERNVDTSPHPGLDEDDMSPHVTRRLQTMMTVLREWTKYKLSRSSWEDTLGVATHFVLPKSAIYQAICEHLESIDRAPDAVSCFHQMSNQLTDEIEVQPTYWVSDFMSRNLQKSEEQGNRAMHDAQYSAAVSNYTIALSLNPNNPHDLLVQRSRAYVASGLWEDALNDANEVIRLDPSSPLGYERKNAALHGAGRYHNAVDALEMMLSKMSQSSDLDVRDRSLLYVQPTQARETIRAAVEAAIRKLPPLLINTRSGRLLDKSGQASSFESLPIFHELISSMITDIDHARIKQEVTQHYRFASLSDMLENNGLQFDMDVAVYDLEESPTHSKLQMFCRITREAGFDWAWSDICCITTADHRELVNRFKWYQSSAMTIVFLHGVPHNSARGAMTRSIWNTKLWSLQTYHMSRVVRFYTEDWTPYMNLTLHNHKESPEVISEIEAAAGVPGSVLMALRPGLDNIPEKLRLASTYVETPRVEDTVYSLLGLFSLSMPVVYGEGDKALGRLLVQLLTLSGSTSILAWTGRPGSLNTCLPGSISVFREGPTSHIPPPTTIDVEAIASSFTMRLSLVMELYDRLNELPLPKFSGQRMRLPCLCFAAMPVLISRNGSTLVFHAQTTALGFVEIRTNEDVSRFGSLYFVHPWIDFLVDRRPVGNRMERTVREDTESVPAPLRGDLPPYSATASDVPDSAQSATPLRRSFGRHRITVRSDQDVLPLRPSSTTSLTERQTQALEMIARLRKPFGALLLTPIRAYADEYKRVVAETLITVQVQEMTPMVLNQLIQCVRVLDVL